MRNDPTDVRSPAGRPDPAVCELEALRRKLAGLTRANVRLRARCRALEHSNERLSQLSSTDELTALPNHRAFRNSLARELKRALRSHSELSLVLFDIDDFKSLNDSCGHAVGDAILAQVARAMRSAVRDIDLLARYGGEEFALLAPGTGIEGAVAVAEKVRLAVGRAAFPVIGLTGQDDVRVTLSAGVARFEGDERRLFNDADRALYQAKSSGKDCVVFWPGRHRETRLEGPAKLGMPGAL